MVGEVSSSKKKYIYASIGTRIIIMVCVCVEETTYSYIDLRVKKCFFSKLKLKPYHYLENKNKKKKKKRKTYRYRAAVVSKVLSSDWLITRKNSQF